MHQQATPRPSTNFEFPGGECEVLPLAAQAASGELGHLNPENVSIYSYS
jgi:hypothetical protein